MGSTWGSGYHVVGTDNLLRSNSASTGAGIFGNQGGSPIGASDPDANYTF